MSHFRVPGFQRMTSSACSMRFACLVCYYHPKPIQRIWCRLSRCIQDVIRNFWTPLLYSLLIERLQEISWGPVAKWGRVLTQFPLPKIVTAVSRGRTQYPVGNKIRFKPMWTCLQWGHSFQEQQRQSRVHGHWHLRESWILHLTPRKLPVCCMRVILQLHMVAQWIQCYQCSQWNCLSETKATTTVGQQSNFLWQKRLKRTCSVGVIHCHVEWMIRRCMSQSTERLLGSIRTGSFITLSSSPPPFWRTSEPPSGRTMILSWLHTWTSWASIPPVGSSRTIQTIHGVIIILERWSWYYRQASREENLLSMELEAAGSLWLMIGQIKASENRRLLLTQVLFRSYSAPQASYSRIGKAVKIECSARGQLSMIELMQQHDQRLKTWDFRLITHCCRESWSL